MFMIDVVDVKALEGHKLELTFKDGLRAVVDMDKVIERFDGVFRPPCGSELFSSGLRGGGNRHDCVAKRRRRVPRRALLPCLRQTDYRQW